MDYFDNSYFDPSYFDTDSATSGTEGPSGKSSGKRRRRPNVMVIEPPQIDDEDWITVLL